jgi:hypothetical protein
MGVGVAHEVLPNAPFRVTRVETQRLFDEVEALGRASMNDQIVTLFR